MKPRKKLRMVEPEQEDKEEEGRKHLMTRGDESLDEKDESSESDSVIEDEDEEAGKSTANLDSLRCRRHGH